MQPGDRFHRWTVTGPAVDSGTGDGSVAFPCVCDCGNTKDVKFRLLGRDDNKSCGCLQKETAASLKFKHGQSYDINYKRAGWYRRTYGISMQDLERMIDEQDDCCLICDEPMTAETRCVDHDHETGKVRGLLCRWCNLALGYMKDDVKRMKRAISYLEQD